LAELEWQGAPERRALRRAIRHELLRRDGSWRVIAEELLAESSRIDLLVRGAEGELVVIRIGAAEEDAALLTRLLSDRAWLAPRIEDWMKLAPELDLDPTAGIRGLLVCPDFGRETCLATTGLPERSMELLRYRFLAQQGRLVACLEPVSPGILPDPASVSEDEEIVGRPSRHDLETDPAPVDPPRPSRFRTGLRDADLGMPSRSWPKAD